MLLHMHGAIRGLLHEKGRVSPHDVDVCFESPRRDWIASLTRPTVDFFLFEVKENTELRNTALARSRDSSRATYRVPPRRFDLRYMVSALTTIVEDEHLLLWRTLVTLLRYPMLPDTVLTPELRVLDPPISTRIVQPDEEARLLDVWTGLETPPRPALLYEVTVPVDLEIEFTAPLVLTRTARYTRNTSEGGVPDIATHIGGIVRDRAGRPLAGARVLVRGRGIESGLTNEKGQYVLAGVPTGELALQIEAPDRDLGEASITVPSESYDVTVT